MKIIFERFTITRYKKQTAERQHHIDKSAVFKKCLLSIEDFRKKLNNIKITRTDILKNKSLTASI
jgi:hypothetical protein